MDCIFCKIIKGEIPSSKVYEDEEFIVIKDVNPQAPVHLLAIPKEHFASVAELNDDRAVVVGKMVKKLAEIAKDNGLDEGFRIITNKGKHGCQSVEHLHLHLLGGRQLDEKMG
ncbi:MAG: histidine triad nucleotide-binding protein [Christensenellales bacterium]